MEKCVIDFQHRSDWDCATKLAQSMGIEPWDIVAKRRVDSSYTLIVYFYNKKQVREFLKFLVSGHSVNLNDIKIHQRKKWKEKRK